VHTITQQHAATCVLAGLLLAGALPPATAKPRPPSSDPAHGLIERVETELVLIEAYVTDRTGRPIENLTADDFTLVVDGNVSPIASFEFVRLPDTVAEPAGVVTAGAEAAPPAAGRARRFILFFDDATSDPQGLTAARHAAEELLATAFTPSDEVALATYDTGLRLLHDFTTDRDALRGALDDSGAGARRISALYTERRAQKEEIEGMLEELKQNATAAEIAANASPMRNMQSRPTQETHGRGRSMSGGAGTGSTQGGAGVTSLQNQQKQAMQQEIDDSLRRVKFLAITYASDETRILRGLLRALGVLVDSLSAWPGHKTLVFMGDGIPENASVPYVDAILKVQPDMIFATRAQTFTLAQDVNALRRAAAAAGVTIHTLRTAGLAAGTEEEMKTAYGMTNTIAALALGTGGLRGQTNDLLAELRDVEHASRSYYVLGYSPAGPADGAFHPVQVRCRRPKSQVRSRAGFVRYAPAEARERTIKAAHVLPDLYRDLPIDLSVAPGPVTKSDRVVDLVVHVPTGAVLFLPEEGGRTAAHLAVGLVALDEHGKETLRAARAMRVTRLPVADIAGGIEIYARARLPDREQSVTAVVRDDAAGVVGAARATLHGSETQPDVIQGLSLYSPGESSLWIEMPIVGKDGDAAGDGAATDHHLVGPALKSTFEPGESAVLGFRRPEPKAGPDAKPGPAPGLVVVIRRGGEIVRSLSIDPPGAGAHPTVKVPLPVQGLAPGDYTVAVEERVERDLVDRATVPLRIREVAAAAAAGPAALAPVSPPNP
jgi:VWFA-related protein